MRNTVVIAIALGINIIGAQPTRAAVTVNCFLGLVDTQPCPAGAQTTLPTWYIPASGENEPGSEPPMTITFSGFPWTNYTINDDPTLRPRPGPNAAEAFRVLDPDGSTVSDEVILFPPGGDFIRIVSDPDARSDSPFNLGTLAQEVEGQGVTAKLTLLFGLSELRFTFGFDDEFVFDPFNVGLDTSDSVQMSGSPAEEFDFTLLVPNIPTPGRIPEPDSLAVLAFALAAFASYLALGVQRGHQRLQFFTSRSTRMAASDDQHVYEGSPDDLSKIAR